MAGQVDPSGSMANGASLPVETMTPAVVSSRRRRSSSGAAWSAPSIECATSIFASSIAAATRTGPPQPVDMHSGVVEILATRFAGESTDQTATFKLFGAVLLFHLLIVYALVSGLAKKVVDVVRRLVASADILVENFRPDVKFRLGIDYQALCKDHPRLIYASRR